MSHPQSPANPPPTLTTLPRELLARIAGLLDKPTSLVFARIAPSFLPLVEQNIWQKLLFDTSSSRIDSILKQDPCGEGWDAALWAAELDRRRDMRDKMDNILEQASMRRRRMVEEVWARPRPGSVKEMVKLLELLPSLRRLEIVAPESIWHIPVRDPDSFDTVLQQLAFDLDQCNIAIRFPYLQELILSERTVRYIEIIPLICTLAPNLVTLEVDCRNDTRLVLGDWDEPKPPLTVTSDTKLRTLRLSYTDVEDNLSDFDPLEPVVSLLQRSPFLERLSISHPSSEPEDLERVINPIYGMMHLKELNWEVPVYALEELATGAPEGLRLGTLRHLGMRYSHWDIPSMPDEPSPSMPLLETVIIDFQMRFGASASIHTFYPLASPVQLLKPGIAAWLRHCLSLHSIHFIYENSARNSIRVFDAHKEIRQGSMGDSCIVRSVRHGSDELLRVRLRLAEVVIPSSSRWCYRDDYREGHARIIEGLGWLDPMWRYGIVCREPEWQEFTEWEGKLVPLEVVERMREVAGISEEEWDRRGVVVEDEAWAVLLEWSAGAEGLDGGA